MPKLTFVCSTDIGNRRPVNEDTVWPRPDMSVHPYARSPHGLLFVVADGMGGHGAGDTASQLVVEALLAAYYDRNDPEPNPALRLEQAIRAAHQAIRARATTPEFARMGSTVVAVVIKTGRMWIAWAGDSRAYRLHNGCLQLLTQDHSELWDAYQAKTISWEAMHYHVRRSTLTNSLTALRPLTAVAHESAELQPGDRVLLFRWTDQRGARRRHPEDIDELAAAPGGPVTGRGRQGAERMAQRQWDSRVARGGGQHNLDPDSVAGRPGAPGNAEVPAYPTGRRCGRGTTDRQRPGCVAGDPSSSAGNAAFPHAHNRHGPGVTHRHARGPDGAG
jgi:serine/threonine-protein phosphatase Stp1